MAEKGRTGRYSAKGRVMTLGELRAFIEGLPDCTTIYFFTKDDCWDSVSDIDRATIEGDTMLTVDHLNEEIQDEIEEGKDEDEEIEVPEPDCIVFTGNHN